VSLLLAASPLGAVSYDEKDRTPLALAEKEVFGDDGVLQQLGGARDEGWVVLRLTHEDTLLRPLIAP
jgi:hypothetical protein